MSMNTYPLEEKCMLLFSPDLACAILVQDAIEEGNGTDLPVEIQEALEAGKTVWDCVSDPALRKVLAENDWDSVSDAYDAVEAAGESDTVYCSEFTGTSSVPDEFAAAGGAPEEFEDAYIAGLTPLREAVLFAAAYPSPDALLQEYRDRLGGLAGPDVPLGKFVKDMSGTYFC